MLLESQKKSNRSLLKLLDLMAMITYMHQNPAKQKHPHTVVEDLRKTQYLFRTHQTPEYNLQMLLLQLQPRLLYQTICAHVGTSLHGTMSLTHIAYSTDISLLSCTMAVNTVSADGETMNWSGTPIVHQMYRSVKGSWC